VADPFAYVSLDDVQEYLVDTSATPEEIVDALAAERAAQAARCRVEPFTQDLRQALLRRVARNLAARRVPVASMTSFDGGQTSTRVPRVDPEVSRLEAPYRRMTVG
jgi:acyl-CoA reductase-like NAD-dependent aldehyde dehydrogenase